MDFNLREIRLLDKKRRNLVEIWTHMDCNYQEKPTEARPRDFLITLVTKMEQQNGCKRLSELWGTTKDLKHLKLEFHMT
jgi:hypothetical protein